MFQSSYQGNVSTDGGLLTVSELCGRRTEQVHINPTPSVLSATHPLETSQDASSHQR